MIVQKQRCKTSSSVASARPAHDFQRDCCKGAAPKIAKLERSPQNFSPTSRYKTIRAGLGPTRTTLNGTPDVPRANRTLLYGRSAGGEAGRGAMPVVGDVAGRSVVRAAGL